MTTHTVFDVRQQCPRGHFVAASDVHCEDHLDNGAYYGVSTSYEYTCNGCERANVGPYMYFGPPRLVTVREYGIETP
jgi:hypothetical protein